MVRTYYFIRIFEYVIRIIRFFTPWVTGAFTFTLGLIATSVITFWGGVPRRVDQLANLWVDRAYLAGFPGEWTRQLYYVLYCLAFSMIVLGWIILSFITVWLVRVIF